jgi:hypothetical protein
MSKIRLTFFCVARSNSKNTETAFWGLDGVLACGILSQESFSDEKVSRSMPSWQLLDTSQPLFRHLLRQVAKPRHLNRQSNPVPP